MKLEILNERQYVNYLKQSNNYLFFHSLEWAKFKKNTGWDYEIIGLKDEKKIKAAAILLGKKVPFLNKLFYYCPRGYLIDYNDFQLLENFTKLLKEYLKKQNAIFLKINPYVEYVKRDKDGNIISDKKNDQLITLLKKNGYKHYGLYKTFDEKKDLEPRWLSVLYLKEKNIDQILKDMRATTRWLISKSKKNFITIREASYDDLIEFKKIMEHTAGRRNFEDRDLAYYQEMYKELNKSDIYKLLLANIDLKSLKNSYEEQLEHLNLRINNIINNPKKHNQFLEFESQKQALQNYLNQINNEIQKYGYNPLISAGLYLCYGNQIVYLYGASYKEFMNYGAQYLMQYYMIEYGKEKNYEKLNFYGIDGDFSKEGKHFGLFDFKRGFNADVIELIGEFDLVGNKFYYWNYKFLFKVYKSLKRIKRVIKK